jgi:pimeloyl-ACP methyl ester carboxylesterase
MAAWLHVSAVEREGAASSMRVVVASWVFLCAVATAPACRATDVEPPRFVEAQGGRLHVEVVGSGPPLLFLHGDLLFFQSNFARQRDYFATFRTVIGIDQQGHGHSPDRGRPLSYKQMAEDTAAVIRALSTGPVDIVGHSGGGNVALILARDHPQLVRRIVVSGANLRPGLPQDELERRRKWSREQVAQKVREIADKLPPRFRAEYERVSPDGPAHWMTMVTKAYRMWLDPVMEPEDLRGIKAPVLVMAGDHDFTPIEETVEIYRNLPAGQLMILPGTGHGTFSERPELANRAIRDFVEHDDGAATR